MPTNNNWNNAIAGANSAITLNSGTNNVNISTDASATTVAIGTGAAAKSVTVGSTNGASSLALKTGTADFSLASATGTIISALDTGEITYPLQSAFSAYLGTDDLNVTGNSTQYVLGTNTALTEVFDQNSDFNTNGTFTAPVTGRYFFEFTIRLSGITVASTACATYITTSNRQYRSNGYNSGACRVASTGVLQFSMSAFADMDASDTATFSVLDTGEAGDVVDILGVSGSTLLTFMGGYLVC